MRDLLKISFLLIMLISVYICKDSIASIITDKFIYKGTNKVLSYNEYYSENDYLFIQNTDISHASNYQDILNIIYTIINSGDDCYSFFCDYENCIKDVKNLIDNTNIIAEINNFVHPYNSFNTININIGTDDKITVTIDKIYDSNKINFINNYIEQFNNSSINLSMTNYDKIKAFHDNIINNTIYDEENSLDSYTAYSLITSGKSICGGYSDIMAIYLNTLNLKNYKITSKNHVWNLVELDGIWYHIDATWNDPVASDGNQYLLHNFFMISTERLLELDKVEHNYNKSIYLEANKKSN